MTELEEFAEALFDQLSVETDEERNIAGLSERIRDDRAFDAEFEGLEDASYRILPGIREKLAEFSGFDVQDMRLEFADLGEFKKLKGRKVFAAPGSRGFVDDLFLAVSDQDITAITRLIDQDLAKYLVYSTYAIQYMSRISTTYGDYLDNTIYLNRFVLSSYPQIILYKQGPPYVARFDSVNSGYRGALKMVLLEELVHSQQERLHSVNKQAAMRVNELNEELADYIIRLDDDTASELYEYMQLQTVPDDFPIARRANLFFMLNPDNFIVNVLGPDVMTYTKIDIDPRISSMVPELLGIYQRWLGPIQTHHAVFSVMEGMAEFMVENILRDDENFQNYLTTFMGTDMSAYTVRKSLGRDFTRAVYAELSQDTFDTLLDNPPSTVELKDPARFLERVR